MTPIEALAQIVQSAELNPATSVNRLAAVARVALRESGEHGLLFVLPNRDLRTIHCYCGWEWISTGGIATADELIAEHVKALEVTA